MALSPVITDKSSGKAYQLQPSGYYKEMTTPAAGATPVDSIAGAYSAEANSQIAPYYDTAKANATAEGDQTAKVLAAKVGQEYSNKGLLRSGMYGDVYTQGQAGVARDTTSRLSELEKARTGEYNTLFNNSMSRQQSGQQFDTEQALKAAEAERAQKQWEQEQAAKASENERQQKRWEQEQQFARETQAANMQMEKLRLATARSSGGSSTTSWENAQAKQNDLNASIQGAVEDWKQREQSRIKNRQAPGRESEDIYVPRIMALAASYGIDPEVAKIQFYNLRDSYGLRK